MYLHSLSAKTARAKTELTHPKPRSSFVLGLHPPWPTLFQARRICWATPHRLCPAPSRFPLPRRLRARPPPQRLCHWHGPSHPGPIGCRVAIALRAALVPRFWPLPLCLHGGAQACPSPADPRVQPATRHSALPRDLVRLLALLLTLLYHCRAPPPLCMYHPWQ